MENEQLKERDEYHELRIPKDEFTKLDPLDEEEELEEQSDEDNPLDKKEEQIEINKVTLPIDTIKLELEINDRQDVVLGCKDIESNMNSKFGKIDLLRVPMSNEILSKSTETTWPKEIKYPIPLIMQNTNQHKRKEEPEDSYLRINEVSKDDNPNLLMRITEIFTKREGDDNSLAFIESSISEQFIKARLPSPQGFLRKIHPRMFNGTIDLLEKILITDPHKRISITKTLEPAHTIIEPERILEVQRKQLQNKEVRQQKIKGEKQQGNSSTKLKNNTRAILPKMSGSFEEAEHSAEIDEKLGQYIEQHNSYVMSIIPFARFLTLILNYPNNQASEFRDTLVHILNKATKQSNLEFKSQFPSLSTTVAEYLAERKHKHDSQDKREKLLAIKLINSKATINRRHDPPGNCISSLQPFNASFAEQSKKRRSVIYFTENQRRLIDFKPRLANVMVPNQQVVFKHQAMTTGGIFALLLWAYILRGTNLLLAHYRHHSYNCILPLSKTIFDLSKQLIIDREPEIILGASRIGQQTHKSILRDIDQMVISTIKMRNIMGVKKDKRPNERPISKCRKKLRQSQHQKVNGSSSKALRRSQGNLLSCNDYGNLTVRHRHESLKLRLCPEYEESRHLDIGVINREASSSFDHHPIPEFILRWFNPFFEEILPLPQKHSASRLFGMTACLPPLWMTECLL
eukprot:Gb_11235 [translate_table: standard]